MIDLFSDIISFANKNGTMGIVCMLLLTCVIYLYRLVQKREQELHQERQRAISLEQQRYEDLIKYHEAANDLEKEITRRFEQREREFQVALRDVFDRGVTYGKHVEVERRIRDERNDN